MRKFIQKQRIIITHRHTEQERERSLQKQKWSLHFHFWRDETFFLTDKSCYLSKMHYFYTIIRSIANKYRNNRD